MSSKKYLKKTKNKINRKFNSDGKKKSSGSAPTCSVDCHNFAEGACAQFVLCQHTELVLRPRLQPRHHQPGLSTRNWHRVPVVWTEVSSLWPKNKKKTKNRYKNQNMKLLHRLHWQTSVQFFPYSILYCIFLTEKSKGKYTLPVCKCVDCFPTRGGLLRGRRLTLDRTTRRTSVRSRRRNRVPRTH